MDSQNIFDVFGRQIKTESNQNLDKIIENKISELDLNQINNLNLRNEFDGKIDKMKKEFEVGVKKLLSDLKTHIEKANKLTEAIGVEKNYISLNRKKRIVGVKPSINKNDVVIKLELEELTDSFLKVVNDLSSFKKKTDKNFNEHTEDYNRHKQHVKDFVTEMYEFKQNVESKISIVV